MKKDEEKERMLEPNTSRSISAQGCSRGCLSHTFGSSAFNHHQLRSLSPSSSSSENILVPGPSGVHFNHLKLHYIEVDSDENSEEYDTQYSVSGSSQEENERDNIFKEFQTRPNKHDFTPKIRIFCQGSFEQVSASEDECNDDYFGSESNIELMVKKLSNENDSNKITGTKRDPDGSGEDVDGALEEQLTITSNGSKMSSSSKKSTASLIINSTECQKGQSKQWMIRKGWESRTTHSSSVVETSNESRGNQNLHLNSHPHTVTCRPISESSSVAQLSMASSVASFSDPNAPMCKICHLHGKEGDPLISPCRCSGTMQYIHCGCLMRWLEISSKKSRKPLACELCQYKYHWHKKFKVRHWQFPHVSSKDKLLHVLFFLSVTLMLACGIVTVMCFKHERGQKIDPHRTELTLSEIITLVCGVLFFLSFFVAMYVEVKARNTLYKLCVKFMYLNQQWYIDEYEKDVVLGPEGSYCTVTHKEDNSIEPVTV